MIRLGHVVELHAGVGSNHIHHPLRVPGVGHDQEEPIVCLTVGFPHPLEVIAPELHRQVLRHVAEEVVISEGPHHHQVVGGHPVLVDL